MCDRPFNSWNGSALACHKLKVPTSRFAERPLQPRGHRGASIKKLRSRSGTTTSLEGLSKIERVLHFNVLLVAAPIISALPTLSRSTPRRPIAGNGCTAPLHSLVIFTCENIKLLLSAAPTGGYALQRLLKSARNLGNHTIEPLRQGRKSQPNEENENSKGPTIFARSENAVLLKSKPAQWMLIHFLRHDWRQTRNCRLGVHGMDNL